MAACAGLNIGSHVSIPWADSLSKVNYSSFQHLDKMIQAIRNAYHILQYKSSSPQSEQIILSDLAMNLIKKSRDKFSNEQDKLRMLSFSNDWMLLSFEVMDIKKQSAKAFEIAELNKAGLLLEASKTTQAHQFGTLPEDLIAKEKELLKKQTQLEADLLENHVAKTKDSLRVAMNQLNLNINAFKSGIEKKYPKYAAFKYAQTEVKSAEIQALLPPKTALLEYVLGDSVIYIFYLDKQNLRSFEQFINNDELKERIKNLHEALSNYDLLTKDAAKSYKSYTENAYWFYQKLLAPMLENSTPLEQLIIVSDGELGHLPFESFLTKQAPQVQTSYNDLNYLVIDYNISYNYSATLWKENLQTAKHKNNGQFFAMAANYKNVDSSKIALRTNAYQRIRNQLLPLPAAQEEVKMLKESFVGFFGFNDLASERIFKEKASAYSIIHLSMHGLLDNSSPILSSLAFTEDGDSVENNFLQAYEISKMDLNADLVVLSACETGYGRFEKGNGIASLARAFMYAGASSLVVSLWQVNDFSTAALMKFFYANLAAGMDKAVALRQAKLSYIKQAKDLAAHPAFWSPFILMGNTDAITLGRTRGFAPTWIIGGAVLLVLGGIGIAFARKKR